MLLHIDTMNVKISKLCSFLLLYFDWQNPKTLPVSGRKFHISFGFCFKNKFNLLALNVNKFVKLILLKPNKQLTIKGGGLKYF